MILSANTHIVGIMTEGITNKISLNVEKESIPDLFGCHYLLTTGLIRADVQKTIMFVFHFSSLFDYMYLFPKMNYMRSCCLAYKYCVLVCTHTCYP
jgi:hypothetical protein